MNRERLNYPQVDRIDDNGTQWIELNRGCKRGCAFCYADPNYKQFQVPQIRSRIVQIIGEGFLYDTEIKEKIKTLGSLKVEGRCIYYGLSQGIDFRLLDEGTAALMAKNRIGYINNKGRWYKGMRFAWDLGMEQKDLALKTIELLERAGYKRKVMQIFVLVNWKIPFSVCLEKIRLLREWGVKIDDCTWDTTKKEMKPHFWKLDELKQFRRMCRQHNQEIQFRGWSEYAKEPLTSGRGL